MTRALRIGFLHPDLGIGGAERLVLDAALQMQAAGHHVTLFTTHHDHTRCFEETRDGTLQVHIYGDCFPRAACGRLVASWAILRMAYLSQAVIRQHGPFDVLFCDTVGHILPWLRRLSPACLVFYCHFPDLLLTPPRTGWYRWYRAPIDSLEARAMTAADRILVNSQFTAEAFRQTFPLCPLVPEVLYPGVDCSAYAPVAPDQSRNDEILLLSLNRYEAKKNVALALEALSALRAQLDPSVFTTVRLVIAGGYDERLRDNRETFLTLQNRARELHLTDHVRFLRSITSRERLTILSRCRAVLYTPEHEHFGYVPLEAMAAARPVVAVDNGGPKETIRQGETGFLCESTPEMFADALKLLILDRAMARRMGEAGRRFVARNFSLSMFGEKLNWIITDMVK